MSVAFAFATWRSTAARIGMLDLLRILLPGENITEGSFGSPVGYKTRESSPKTSTTLTFGWVYLTSSEIAWSTVL